MAALSYGMDAETGRTLTGWSHVEQSVKRIFFTRIGERLMREWFGSYVPSALGQPLTEETIMRMIATIAAALELWEPRVRLVDVSPAADPRVGAATLILQMAYRPRALQGDLSEEASPLRIALSLAGNGPAVIETRA